MNVGRLAHARAGLTDFRGFRVGAVDAWEKEAQLLFTLEGCCSSNVLACYRSARLSDIIQSIGTGVPAFGTVSKKRFVRPEVWCLAQILQIRARNSLSSDCLRFLEKVIEQTIVKRLD